MIIYCMLSGGIDSTTALTRAIFMEPSKHTEAVKAVSFNYGQRHLREIESAKEICDHYDVEHVVLTIPMPRTMLTDPSVEVPDISYDQIKGVSPTYVPFRNGLMLSTLTSYIAGRHLDPLLEGDEWIGDPPDVQIWWGAHAEDAENWAYPDCTVEFMGAMANAIHVGTYYKVRLVTPFAAMMKHEIVKMGRELEVPYEKTFSCYKGGEIHCGTCATCQARSAAFTRAGVPDPTEYKIKPPG
jgi:7-cyano-7-deazaguanine synthase